MRLTVFLKGVKTENRCLSSESYELDVLLKADDVMWRNITNQALTEAFGEGATEISNMAADCLIMGKNSNYERNIRQYMEDNPTWSYEEAQKQALIDSALQIAEASGGGLISGGSMAGGMSIVQNVSQQANSVNQEDVAKSLRNKGVYSRKVDGLAEAIAARLNGQELTRSQRSFLSFELGSPAVQDVISEFIKKKAAEVDSTQSNVYDRKNVARGVETREEAALWDLAKQRVGGDRSGGLGRLREIGSLPQEAFSAAQHRGLTSEVDVFGDNDYATAMGGSSHYQGQKAVSKGIYEGDADVIKQNLVNKVKDIRAKMPNTNLAKRGNMAVAHVDVPGIKSNFVAHSKINTDLDKGADVADFSFLKPENERIFTSYIDDQYPRYHDTEAKILEDIASHITDSNVSGTINLYSQLPCCQSCSNIILEFRRMFPNINLNIFVE